MVWDCLLQLLSARGFRSKWCKWTFNLLSTSKSSIFINGKPGRNFQHSKDLGQGDALSPQLLLLVADTLDRVFKRAASNNLIVGISPLQITGQMQRLQFADDTLLFCNADVVHVHNLKFILYSYELLTGLQIDFQKSYVLGIRLSNSQVSMFANILGSKKAEFPITYSGILHH